MKYAQNIKNKKTTIVLGIETSCDETAASVVSDDGAILSNVIVTQLSEHEKFGGVVPEVAARAHLHYLPNVIKKAIKEANISINEIDAVAATSGPGLIGGVMVGCMAAKTIAMSLNKKFLAINHLMGHALTVRLSTLNDQNSSNMIDFPYLLLLVSGGHTQLILVKSTIDYEIIGATIDDAAGECFDKVAKTLNLPHPGGPNLEKLAKDGDPTKYKLPTPLCGANHMEKNKYNFSFSGLKTAVRSLTESLSETEESKSKNKNNKKDIAASFQQTMADIFYIKTKLAIAKLKEEESGIRALVVAGGVAANSTIRKRLMSLTKETNIAFIAPPINLCTDNAAMIAWAGIEKLKLDLCDSLDFAPKPRWPLDKL